VRGSSRVAGRNPVTGPRGATANGASPQQLQALLMKAAEREGRQNPAERRRIEKLRRDAVRRALGH